MQATQRRYQNLREIYEEEFGRSISDRTWQRVKNRILIADDEDLTRAEEVRMAATLQKENPRKQINSITVRKALRIERQFPTNITMSGVELYYSICNIFGREIPAATVYRWGWEINVPFSRKRHYSPDHLKIWAKKIVPNSY